MLAVCDQSDFEDFEWLWNGSRDVELSEYSGKVDIQSLCALLWAKLQIKNFKRHFLSWVFENSAVNNFPTKSPFDVKISAIVFFIITHVPYKFYYRSLKIEATRRISIFSEVFHFNTVLPKCAYLSEKLSKSLEIYRGHGKYYAKNTCKIWSESDKYFGRYLLQGGAH